MNVVVNGQPRDLPRLSTQAALSEVIDALELKGDRVAVELNGSIVPRQRRSEAIVYSGDKLEIVHFVGGGL